MASMDQNDIGRASGRGERHGKGGGSHAHDKRKRQNWSAHDDLSLRTVVRQNVGLQQAGHQRVALADRGQRGEAARAEVGLKQVW